VSALQPVLDRDAEAVRWIGEWTRRLGKTKMRQLKGLLAELNQVL
jgi:hypothetical protein